MKAYWSIIGWFDDIPIEADGKGLLTNGELFNTKEELENFADGMNKKYDGHYHYISYRVKCPDGNK